MKSLIIIMKRLIIAAFLLLGNSLISRAQTNTNTRYPQIGKPCPDFKFDDVHYFSKNTVSLTDFKGKWLVIDIWGKDCLGCIHSLPRINQLQQRYKEQLQYFLVADVSDKESLKSTVSLYERCRKLNNLELPIAYAAVSENYDIRGFPYIVVVDPQGIVKAITDELSDQNVADLLDRKNPEIKYARRLHEPMPQINSSKPFLLDSNGGQDTAYLFRSLLAKYNPQYDCFLPGRMNPRKKSFVAAGVDLMMLYSYAYTGKISLDVDYDDPSAGQLYRYPILEVADTSKFVPNLRKELFSYSLEVPRKMGGDTMMQIMQRDLKNYFGYKVSFENRIRTCWNIIATAEAKKRLITKGQPPKLDSKHYAGFTMTNYPLKFLTATLNNVLGFYRHEVFVDATGINQNIDLEVNALLVNFDEVRTALNKNGLDLVKSTRTFHVMVISDPKAN